jgi:peptide/nickel transport system substrate-binding protein
MSMNVRTPPFDDVRVRQAVNYAVDRRAYTELVGGSDLADATCQFVPPGFPNYAPECRYTLEPNPGGAYTAPDLARARRLIEQSRTAGMDVTVWTIPSHETTGEFFVSLLRRLGYRSTLRVHKDIGAYFQLIFDPRTRPQMALSAWGADTGAPSQFAGLYTCDWPGSLTGYCDRGFETRVDAALAARGPEAGARWKEAYSYLAEAAPAVPLVNHRTVVFVSDRVGNYEQHPSWLSLLDRLWVR